MLDYSFQKQPDKQDRLTSSMPQDHMAAVSRISLMEQLLIWSCESIFYERYQFASSGQCSVSKSHNYRGRQGSPSTWRSKSSSVCAGINNTKYLCWVRPTALTLDNTRFTVHHRSLSVAHYRTISYGSILTVLHVYKFLFCTIGYYWFILMLLKITTLHQKQS